MCLGCWRGREEEAEGGLQESEEEAADEEEGTHPIDYFFLVLVGEGRGCDDMMYVHVGDVFCGGGGEEEEKIWRQRTKQRGWWW